jgi:hypothetical protein
MAQATGTYRDGHVFLDGPVDWPDGARVAVVTARPSIGMREEDWPTDEAGIQQLVDHFANFEPLEMTEEEEREWMEWREAAKRYTLEAMHNQTDFLP